MSVAADAPPLLEGRRVAKNFGGEVALAGVDFDLRPGEIHGLVGSNGAGKSTLMKILAGVLPDHEGELFWNGAPVRLSSPQAARAQGVAMVYQELSGIGQLSVAENLFLGRQPSTRFGRIDWRRMRREAAAHLAELEIDVDVRRRLDRYPLAVRQMVEIARGVHSGAQALILDEPTSSLSPPETQRLFRLMRRLRADGVAMIFITHFLDDVLAVCDRVTILRDGAKVLTADAVDLDKGRIIHHMLGRGVASETEVPYEQGVRLPAKTDRPPAVVVENLSLPGAFQDISFQVAPGECLGLYGFVGAGHQELIHAVGGAVRPARGRVLLEGKPLPSGNATAAVRRGVVIVAADREHALFHKAPIYQNATLAHLAKRIGAWLTRGREVRAVRPALERVGLKPPNPLAAAGSLSGGNQQKVVFAKWLLGPIRVLLLEEPTRGMDVGAKEEVLRLVAEQQAAGAAVLLATTEPELALSRADRILVFSRGQVAKELADCEVDAGELMRWS